jgi:hypothetical protein
MAKRRAARPRRPPTVAYRLISHGDEPDMYLRLHELVDRYHEELGEARIALAWCTSWRADIDGHLKIGMCRRASDLDRELHEWDFIVLLNREFWHHEQTTGTHRDALLDHELSHATVKRDPLTGDVMKNDRGKVVYRIRKHDIEEFVAIPKRHGLWRHELDAFARVCLAALDHPRLPLASDEDDLGDASAGVH